MLGPSPRAHLSVGRPGEEVVVEFGTVVALEDMVNVELGRLRGLRGRKGVESAFSVAPNLEECRDGRVVWLQNLRIEMR